MQDQAGQQSRKRKNMQDIIAIVGEGDGLSVIGLDQVTQRMRGALHTFQSFRMRQPVFAVAGRQRGEVTVWHRRQQLMISLHAFD